MGPEIITIVITIASLVFGLLITGVTFFIVWKVISGFTKSMQESQQLIATGLPAQGRVLSVHDVGGSIQIGGQLPQHRLQIELEVYPMNGQPPFRASVTQLVSMLAIARVQPGATVDVRYDATNPMRAALVI
jgi:hypothetical protein